MRTATRKKARIPEAPYGWEYVREGERLLLRPLATEMWVIRYIRQLRAFGCTPEEIAEELRCDDIRDRQEKPFDRAEIEEILSRDDEPLWQLWEEQDCSEPEPF